MCVTQNAAYGIIFWTKFEEALSKTHMQGTALFDDSQIS